MSLREQFEAWLKANYPGIVDRWVDDPEREAEAMWHAYQAGHAASGRDELIQALHECVGWLEDNQIDCIALDVAREAIAKARGET